MIGPNNGAVINVLSYIPTQYWDGIRHNTNNTDLSTYIQNAINDAISAGAELFFPGNGTATVEYRIETKLIINGKLSIRGESKAVTLYCVNCDGLEYSATAIIRSSVRDIGIAASVRHTTTPNAFSAIAFLGDTSNRPYWCYLDNLFIDGFSVGINLEWAWEFKITNVNTLYGGIGVKGAGITNNNKIHNCSFSGNGTQISLLDSTNTKEGWIITNNFFDSAPKAIDTIGGAFFIFSNNVIDHVAAGGTAILMRSSATLPSIGHRICHNQIFFDGAGAEGIRLLNNTSSTQNHGNVLDGNEIFYYSGASLSYGIYIDGTSETHNRVLNNSIFASTRDCYNVGTNSIFTGNKWLNGGFNTTQLCEYDNNHGSSASSRSLTKQTFCEVTRYYSSTMPVSGSYVQGDFVENINNSIDGNNMRLTGWYRATTGSGHVLGTDWFAQYVSTVSPAT